MYNFFINFLRYDAFGTKLIKYYKMILQAMELNKIDNETADHVIDLIDTLINTPVLATNPQNQMNTITVQKIQNSVPIELEISGTQTKKIMDIQRNNNVNLVTTKPKNIYIQKKFFPEESEDEPILDIMDNKLIDPNSDRILPLNFDRKKKYTSGISVVPKLGTPPKLSYADEFEDSYSKKQSKMDQDIQKVVDNWTKNDNTKNHMKNPNTNIISTEVGMEYEFIESYGDDNMTEIANKKLKTKKEKQKSNSKTNRKTKNNESKNNHNSPKQKINTKKFTSKTNNDNNNIKKETQTKIKKIYAKPLDMNADSDFSENSDKINVCTKKENHDKENHDKENHLVQNNPENRPSPKKSDQKIILPKPVMTEKETLQDVQIIAKELSKNMVIDVKENLEQTQQFIQNNKYEILVDLINYAIVIIDFLNKLIYQAFNLIQEKIIGNKDNFFSMLKTYYDILFDFFVKKISDKTLDTIGKIEHSKELIIMWNDYKKEKDNDKKQTIIKKFLTDHNIQINNEKIQNIELSELVQLLKDNDSHV
ncbi:putative ORFan [Tupanvirus deep ocean]|uniref:ORFan n=2 Tax=Tupanvirus TaxID=2094720 RepID=A0AC62A7Q3_9VIRU|nr:putative ORFan [Tupanvirus deep ocean]QKU33811.1 putative ORFan [Tupanvirus deep ocean]